MRRLPKPDKYPAFPSSDEDSEFTPSRLAVFIGKAIVVVLALMVLVGLCGLLYLMIQGIANLGEMQRGQ